MPPYSEVPHPVTVFILKADFQEEVRCDRSLEISLTGNRPDDETSHAEWKRSRGSHDVMKGKDPDWTGDPIAAAIKPEAERSHRKAEKKTDSRDLSPKLRYKLHETG